ncbi:Hypp8440 [Branchiostoma lanceolatum]|uniref:Hypp8440 protein n=1 Tax=Branchiostoma lanceolatum TaxID=7740 RepID=A0A8J9Z8L9_BRALA|nr:Hypp8440 [Branchiostoma lanceolatum]
MFPSFTSAMLLLHVGPLALPPTKTETCRKKFGRPAGDVTVDSRSGDLVCRGGRLVCVGGTWSPGRFAVS